MKKKILVIVGSLFVAVLLSIFSYLAFSKFQEIDVLPITEPSLPRKQKDIVQKDSSPVGKGGEHDGLVSEASPFSVVAKGVFKDDNGVYFYEETPNDQGGSIKKVFGADAKTFQYVGDCGAVEKSKAKYFKDKNFVYVENKKLEKVDTQTFVFLGNFESAEGLPYSVSYGKDKNNVYVSCGEIFAQADPETFEVLGGGYAKDARSGWYLSGKLNESIDISSLVNIGGGYAKDKKNIYFIGMLLDKADINSFTLVQGTPSYIFYGKDKNHVYWNGQVQQGVNPENCIDGSPSQSCTER